MELFEYEQHCRICLKARNASKNIFSHIVEGCQEPLVQLIFSLFKIELHPHSAFPQFVCRKCLTEVENILLFKEDLLRSQEFLLNLFRATYPNYVEKKTTNSRKIYNSTGSTSTNLTPLNNLRYLRVQQDCTEKKINISHNASETENNFCAKDPDTRENCKYCGASFKLNHALQDHYSQYHCLAQQPKEKNTSKNGWKQLKSIKTDENKNVSEMQCEQTGINENTSGLNIVTFSRDPDTDDKPAILDIPQASFLQNLNLITLQDAERLKTRQMLPNRTRRKFISRKFKTINRVSAGISKTKSTIRKCTDKSKKLPSNENFTDSFARRSANFLSRYGCRNLNYAYQKRGKILKRSDSGTCNIYQRRKNVNKFVSKATDSSRVGRSSLGPRSLNKFKAVSKEKGCDINLGNSTCNRSISPLKLQLEKVDAADVEGDPLITEVKRENRPRKTKSTIKPIGKNEFLLSPTISKRPKSFAEYRPIQANSFYRSVTTRNKKYLLDNNKHLLRNHSNHILRNKQYSEDFSNYSDNCDSNSGISNSLRKRKKYGDSLKLRLFRPPNLNSRLGSEDQAEKGVWTIGDSSSLKGYDFRKRLQVQIEKSPNIFKRCKTFDKLIYKSDPFPAKIRKPKLSPRENISSSPRRTRSQLERFKSISSTESSHDTQQDIDENITKISLDLKRIRGPKKLKYNNATRELHFGKLNNKSFEDIKIESDDTFRPIIQKVNGQKVKDEHCKHSSHTILNTDDIKEEFLTCDENINTRKAPNIQVNQKKNSYGNYDEANGIPASTNQKMKDIKQELLAEQNESPSPRKLRSHSCENLSFLKYDTQEADDIIYTDVLRKFDSIQSVNKLRDDENQLLKSSFVNKVHNVNVDEDQEFHLTLTHRDFLGDTVPEDLDNADLSEYPGLRGKSFIVIKDNFESECEKRSDTCDFLRSPRRKRQKGGLSSRSSERLKKSLGDKTSDGNSKDDAQLFSGSVNANTNVKLKRNPLVKNSVKKFCKNKINQPKSSLAKIISTNTTRQKKRKECPDKNKASKKK